MERSDFGHFGLFLVKLLTTCNNVDGILSCSNKSDTVMI